MSELHFSQLKLKAKKLALALNILSVFLAIAAIFSIPFPFYRPNWIREVWGLTGLMHAFSFLLLSRQIEKVSLPATLGILGLLLNEQLLVLFSFLRLFSYSMFSIPYLLFFLFSEAVVFALAFSFLSDIRILCAYLKKPVSYMKYSDQEKPHGVNDSGLHFLFGSGLCYAIFAGLIYQTFSLPPSFTYSIMKITGCLVSLSSFVWAGLEIQEYFFGRQKLILCQVKVITHALLLFGFLWVIYRSIPFQSVLSV